MTTRNSVYFASDMHFGAPNHAQSLVREKHFVKWLDSISREVAVLYLVGDTFDVWFDYKRVAPRGYVRLLGKLAELSDQGVEIHVFKGNHDLWYQDYFVEEFGATLHSEPYIVEHYGYKCYIAHGDGLGPDDHGYKFMKKIFTNPFCKWLYGRLHPNTALWLASFASSLSGDYTQRYDEPVFFGEKERLHIHAREIHQQQPDIQYYIFGHRHILRETEISKNTYCINLGDWIRYFSYFKISAEGVDLQTFPLEK